MNPRILSKRELNRSLITRQLLTTRSDHASFDVIEHLIGLQAQVTKPPYIGLWTRVKSFQRDELTQMMADRRVVRATMMRSTLHTVTARDYLWLRPTIQPALTKALKAFYGQKAAGLDVERLVELSTPYLSETPRTLVDMRAFLSTVDPSRDPETMTYAVRTHYPVVQMPPGGNWGAGGSPAYIPAESWIGEPMAQSDVRRALTRYLTAFGPASIMDFQAWSGMANLKSQIEPFKREFVVYRDEAKRELLDVPDMPIMAENSPAPPRFIPEFDNLILSHADRTRVISDEDYPKVFLSAGRVRATFLIDGFVHGTWKVIREKDSAVLVIEPFRPLEPNDQLTLYNEGERLVRFIEDDAEKFDVRIDSAN